MTAQNIVFCYRIASDAGTVTASSAALPAGNLQAFNLTDIWRSTGVDPEHVEAAFDFGPVRVLALWGHNLTDDAVVRWRIADEPTFADPVFDEIVAPRAAPYGYGVLPYGTFNWGGFPVGGEEVSPRFCLVLLPEAVVGSHVRVDLEDPGNPAGYLQAGRLLVGDAWQPASNFSFGWSLAVVDASRQYETEGNAVYVDKRDPKRELAIPFGFLSESDALTFAAEVAGLVGYSAPALVCMFPDDPLLFTRTAVYGYMRPGSIQPTRQDRLHKYTWGLTIRELLA